MEESSAEKRGRKGGRVFSSEFGVRSSEFRVWSAEFSVGAAKGFAVSRVEFSEVAAKGGEVSMAEFFVGVEAESVDCGAAMPREDNSRGGRGKGGVVVAKLSLVDA